MGPSVEQKIRSATRHAKLGNIDEAIRLYTEILTAFPSNTRAQAGLAALRGTPNTTPASLPAIPQAQLDQLLSLFEQGRVPDVVKRGADLAHGHAPSAMLQHILGVSNAQLSRHEAAAEAFQIVVGLRPDFADAHHGLGVSLHGLGRLSEAAAALETAARLRPHHADTLTKLGITQQDLGRLDDAVETYREALRSNPGDIEALNNAGTCLLKLGDAQAAMGYCKRASSLLPDSAPVWNNLGVCHNEAGKIEAAARIFRSALILKPGFTDAITNLCELTERSNNLEGLRAALDAASPHDRETDADLLYYLGLLHYREDAAERSRAFLERVDLAKLPAKRHAPFFNLQGRVLDKLGAADLAFAAFSRMNAITARSLDRTRYDPDAYLLGVRHLARALATAERSEFPNWTRPPGSAPAPSFMFGFPRSGTTLLDTILRSHSKITVIEERPTISKVEAEIEDRFGLSPLRDLTPSDLERLRGLYFREASKYIAPEDQTRHLIDKYPLKAMSAPLVHALFPDAKYIIAIRHPLDSILSNFMQDFKLNSAMANMLELGRIVDMYCTMMEIWTRSQTLFGLNHHVLRYEDLIEGMPSEAGRLLAFLGLEWEDSLLDYQSTALKRGRIGTPSYSQVVKPLYSDASYRWKRYADHLEPYYNRVLPWIRHFGYDEP